MGAYGSPDFTPKTKEYSKKSNNFIVCSECGFEYSKKFKKCPKCGKKNKKISWWLLIIVIVVIGIVYSSGSEENNSDNSIPNNSTEISQKQNEEPVISKEEYKAQCVSVSYTDVARNPNNYTGKKAMFRGKVIQVQEIGKSVTLRIDVTQGNYGLWEDTVYVDYIRKSDDESRILEEDIVTLYGEIMGIKSYTSVLGNQISIPHLKAEYITIN